MEQQLLSQMSEEYKSTLKQRITASLSRNDKCLLWGKSVSGSGYPQIKITVPGWGKKPMAVHRLVYTLNVGFIRDGYHISHLCHNRLCCLVDHLSHEPAAINSQRIICKEIGRCHGHSSFPACIMYVLILIIA